MLPSRYLFLHVYSKNAIMIGRSLETEVDIEAGPNQGSREFLELWSFGRQNKKWKKSLFQSGLLSGRNDPCNNTGCFTNFFHDSTRFQEGRQRTEKILPSNVSIVVSLNSFPFFTNKLKFLS